MGLNAPDRVEAEGWQPAGAPVYPSHPTSTGGPGGVACPRGCGRYNPQRYPSRMLEPRAPLTRYVPDGALGPRRTAEEGARRCGARANLRASVSDRADPDRCPGCGRTGVVLGPARGPAAKRGPSREPRRQSPSPDAQRRVSAPMHPLVQHAVEAPHDPVRHRLATHLDVRPTASCEAIPPETWV